MGIFDKFKKKDTLTTEEQEQFTHLMSSDEEKLQNEKNDIFSYIKSLQSIHEINKIRNLLDEQEKQITGKDYIEEEMNSNNNYQETTPEEEINNDNSYTKSEKTEFEEDNSNQQFEIEEVDSYKDIEEVQSSDESENKPNSEFSKETSKLYEKLKELFGEENVFTTIKENSELDILKDKKVFHIGVRQKSAFGQDDTTIQDENSWFIRGVKQLENLKEFKMIRSEEGIKDLLLEKGDYAILISFKATTLLNSMDEFDFGI